MLHPRVPLAVLLLILVILLATLSRTGAAPTVAPVEDGPIITVGQLREALEESPWPAQLHDDVVAIARCESGLRFPGERPYLLNTEARGDHDRAHGVMQIRVDVHGRLSRVFDLDDVRENLIAAYLIYLEANRSFAPWSCRP